MTDTHGPNDHYTDLVFKYANAICQESVAHMDVATAAVMVRLAAKLLDVAAHAALDSEQLADLEENYKRIDSVPLYAHTSAMPALTKGSSSSN